MVCAFRWRERKQEPGHSESPTGGELRPLSQALRQNSTFGGLSSRETAARDAEAAGKSQYRISRESADPQGAGQSDGASAARRRRLREVASPADRSRFSARGFFLRYTSGR